MCRPGLNASGRYTAPMRLATPTAWRQSSLKSYSPHGNAVGRARHSVLSHTSKREKTNLNRAVPLCILLLFCAFLQEKRGYPTPENAILHPILHPKSPVNTGILGYGCRKCRIFSENFFCGERKSEGTHRPGSHKTSDFFGQKYGCFASKVRMFASKKSDVFDFRKGGSVEYGFI